MAVAVTGESAVAARAAAVRVAVAVVEEGWVVVLEVARAVAARAVAAVEVATSAADAVAATAVAATVVADAVAAMEAACGQQFYNSLGNSEHSKRVRTCIQHSAQRHSSTRLTSADSGIQMSQ